MTDNRLSGNPKSGDGLSSALSAFKDLDSMFGEEEGSRGVGIELPLIEVLALFPEKYLDTSAEIEPDQPVFLSIPDLLEQLKKGRVSVRMQDVANCVPATALYPEVFDDVETMINLPLQTVVSVMDPAMLQKQGAAARPKTMDFGSLQDPFKKMAVPAKPAEAPAAPAPVAPPPPPAAAAPVVPPPPPVVPVAAAPAPVAPPPPPIVPPAPVLPPPVVAAPAPTEKAPKSMFAPKITIRKEPEAVTPPPAPVAPPPMAPTVKIEAPVAPPAPVVESVVEPEPVLPPPVVPTVKIEAPVAPPAPVVESVVEPEPVLPPPVVPTVKIEEPAASPAPVVEPEAVIPPPPPAVPHPEPPVHVMELPKTPEVAVPAEPRPIRKVEPQPAAEVTGEDRDVGHLGAVNFNNANIGDMLSLEGMVPTLPERIITYRQEKGPFKSIFDVVNVPGFSRVLFKKLTGMPFSAAHNHRASKLAKMLGIPMSKVSDIPAVARAMSTSAGVSGCVVCDREGLIITENSVGPEAEALGAVAADIIANATRNMEMVGVKGLESISVSLEGRMFTIVKCGEVYMTVVHDSNRITGQKMNLIHNVADELAWALSHRAYVA